MWEYFSMPFGEPPAMLEPCLNEMRSHGWELSAVRANGSGLIFKRPMAQGHDDDLPSDEN